MVSLLQGTDQDQPSIAARAAACRLLTIATSPVPGAVPPCHAVSTTDSEAIGAAPVQSRRRREQRLERVLGTPALFATAYGNVGSSIYYALGVTAAFALGLTPLVFVIAA